MIGVWASGPDLGLGVEPGDLKLSRMGPTFWEDKNGWNPERHLLGPKGQEV